MLTNPVVNGVGREVKCLILLIIAIKAEYERYKGSQMWSSGGQGNSEDKSQNSDKRGTE